MNDLLFRPTGNSADSPLPGFRIQYGILLTSDLTVPITVVGDAQIPEMTWPRAAKAVGDAVLTDLPRMTWGPDDRAVVSGIEGKIAAMGVAHALGSRYHQNAVVMNGNIVADPAKVYAYIRGGTGLRHSAEVRPGRPVPIPTNTHAVKHLEIYRAAGTLFARSLSHPALALGSTYKPMIITYEVMRGASRFGLASLAWLAGFFYPEHPLVAEIEVGEAKAHFVVAEHGSFTAGRVAGRVGEERMYDLQ